MPEIFIFGYGSLVNRATHDYQSVHLAELEGWRRAWRHTTLREVAFLNAVPAPDSNIKGLIVGVANSEPSLDRREYAYSRTDVSDIVSHALERPVEIKVFAIPQGLHEKPSGDHVILLSYIDVVVQGYWQEYGEAGVQDFFETTDGWDARIINDRAAPRYPRHQALEPAQIALTDHWLDALAAVVNEL
ncbi:MAG: gamma-glutamylcyclotransferase family protein [Paracoccaceae bacterium]